jgi:hypothetical protein
MGTPSADPDNLVNPAEFSTSSTVQGGNVVNVAVEHHEPAFMDVIEEYSTNAATLAQTTIVISSDEDDASSKGHDVQLYQFLIVEHDNAGALAVTEMQARLAVTEQDNARA